jgi:hypothetical protein
MAGYFTQDSVQVVNDTGADTVGACFARVTINPAPTYQQFFPQPYASSISSNLYAYYVGWSADSTPPSSKLNHPYRRINASSLIPVLRSLRLMCTILEF